VSLDGLPHNILGKHITLMMDRSVKKRKRKNPTATTSTAAPTTSTSTALRSYEDV